jgi:peptidoglycan LD-endopeptidase LytH
MNLVLDNILVRNQSQFHPVVNFDPSTQKLASFDLTERNADLLFIDLADTAAFSDYVDEKRKSAHADYLVGGYDELRTMYTRSELFNDSQDEPRRLHLGIDIWGDAGTEIFVPLGGVVHSFAFNDHFGDYGATIILQHQLEGVTFHTLYGHLGLKDISALKVGDYIARGSLLAHFGKPEENGHWPPHLHFQVIFDMELKEGDYPGVCKYSERERYLSNCPNPDLILNLNRFLK